MQDIVDSVNRINESNKNAWGTRRARSLKIHTMRYHSPQMAEVKNSGQAHVAILDDVRFTKADANNSPECR